MSKKDIFFKLLDQVYPNLEKFALNMTRNRDIARDVVSETVIAAYDSFDKLRNEKAFLSFIFTIAKRKFYEIINDKNIRLVNTDQEIDELFATQLSPEDNADINLIMEAIHELQDDQKEALILYEIIGLKYKEIAEIHDISLNTVKIRIHRARNALSESLNIKSSDHSKGTQK